MILGTITILTGYGEVTLAVEVLGRGPGSALARVKALGGLEPFTRISHGGPYQSSTEVFPLASIRDIHIQPDEEQLSGLAPVSRQTGAAVGWLQEGDDAHPHP